MSLEQNNEHGMMAQSTLMKPSLQSQPDSHASKKTPTGEPAEATYA